MKKPATANMRNSGLLIKLECKFKLHYETELIDPLSHVEINGSGNSRYSYMRNNNCSARSLS